MTSPEPVSQSAAGTHDEALAKIVDMRNAGWTFRHAVAEGGATGLSGQHTRPDGVTEYVHLAEDGTALATRTTKTGFPISSSKGTWQQVLSYLETDPDEDRTKDRAVADALASLPTKADVLAELDKLLPPESAPPSERDRPHDSP